MQGLSSVPYQSASRGKSRSAIYFSNLRDTCRPSQVGTGRWAREEGRQRMPHVRDHSIRGIHRLRGHRGVRKAVGQGRLVFEDISRRSVDTPVFQRFAESALVGKFPRSCSLDSQTEGIENRSRDQSVGAGAFATSTRYSLRRPSSNRVFARRQGETLVLRPHHSTYICSFSARSASAQPICPSRSAPVRWGEKVLGTVTLRRSLHLTLSDQASELRGTIPNGALPPGKVRPSPPVPMNGSTASYGVVVVRPVATAGGGVTKKGIFAFRDPDILRRGAQLTNKLFY